MNLFKRGHEFLTKTLHQSGKESIEYIVGNLRKPLRGQLAVTHYETQDTFGVLTKKEIKDFIVRVIDMPSLPVRGAFIQYNGDRYEVISINGEDCFSYSDEFKQNIRIHTKWVN